MTQIPQIVVSALFALVIGKRRSSTFDRCGLNQTTSPVSSLTSSEPVMPGMMMIGALRVALDG